MQSFVVPSNLSLNYFFMRVLAMQPNTLNLLRLIGLSIYCSISEVL